MLLPGININTGADDFSPIEPVQLIRFDGAAVEALRPDHGQVAA